MAQVTSGAETWVPHTHRHHHSGGTEWLFGPDGPSNVSGNDPQVAPVQIGGYDFMFWAASGTTTGDLTYDAGETSVTPVFPVGTDDGSVIAWYVGRGGNGPANLTFDAFNASADDWLDWDATNDPFTVTSGDRQPGPDDDEVVTTDAPAVVTATGHFPGTRLVFDHWLVFDSTNQHVTAWDSEQLTQNEDTSGYAVAVYIDPSRKKWHFPKVPVAYDPWWWLKNSPVEGIQQLIREQGEAAQIASLIDASTAITSPRARTQVQHGLYEALLSVAHEKLNEGSHASKEEFATH